MSHFFLTLNYWHWFGLAVIMFIIEILTGTGFLLWMGISAVLVGMVALLFSSMLASTQCIIFSLVAILSALVWRLYLHYYPIKTDKPMLNRRAEQYVGQLFTLKLSTINQMGSIQVDDTIWRLKFDKELPAGTTVKIIGTEGVILLAEQIK